MQDTCISDTGQTFAQCDTTPSDATPSDATPSDATPSDATPSDATPSDATPSDTTLDGEECSNQDDGRVDCTFKQSFGGSPLQTGTRVIVRNLGASEMNGNPATVLFYNPKKNRYKVALDTGKVLLLNAECVQRTRHIMHRLVSSVQSSIGGIRSRASQMFVSHSQIELVCFRLVEFYFHVRRTLALTLKYGMERVRRSLPCASSIIPFFTPIVTVLMIVFMFYTGNNTHYNTVYESCAVHEMHVSDDSFSTNESLRPVMLPPY